MMTQAALLTMPQADDVRRATLALGSFLLLGALLVVGGLTTLWLLGKLGPVVYGLPAPLIRRVAAGAPAQAA